VVTTNQTRTAIIIPAGEMTAKDEHSLNLHIFSSKNKFDPFTRPSNLCEQKLAS